MNKPVAISLGDPAGIGPEVIVKTLLADSRLRSRCFLVGDPGVVRREIRRLGRDPALAVEISLPGDSTRASAIRVLGVPGRRLTWPSYGRLSRDAGRMAAVWLEKAARLALAGNAGALVTGPVNKAAVAKSHHGFKGQTEFIAALAGVHDPVMMLAGPTLRVVPATRHIALADVPRTLTAGLVAGCILGCARGLARWFGIRRPRIAVCGLNPHAGEGGLTGREDAGIVAPGVLRAVRAGVNAVGPLPADMVFLAARRGRYDAVVAMYHDQAMIPIKTVEAERAVNATLGLPFLRTSPAHGTAFDIAGRGKANPESMRAAVEMAVKAAGRGE
jgi:4-hydroxythreonine-4-phosphate dehydrogenase